MPNFVIDPNIGNTRGNYAVDLNYVKDISDQVASGYASILIGGANNKTEGFAGAILGGYYNINLGDSSIVFHNQNTNVLDSSMVFGQFNNVNASKSYVGGQYNSVKGRGNHFVFGEYGNFANDDSQWNTVLGTQTFTIGTDNSDGGAEAPRAAILGGGFAWPVHDGEVVRNSRFYEASTLLKQVQQSTLTMYYQGAADSISTVSLQLDGNMNTLPNRGIELTMLPHFNPFTGKVSPMNWNLCVSWTAIDVTNSKVVTGEDYITVKRNNVNLPNASIASVSVSTPTTGLAGDASLLTSQMFYGISPIYNNSVYVRFRPSTASSQFRVVARVTMLQDMYYPQ